MKLVNFVQSNQAKPNRDISSDLLDIVAPADEMSEQVLELTSSLKARDDCESYL